MAIEKSDPDHIFRVRIDECGSRLSREITVRSTSARVLYRTG